MSLSGLIKSKTREKILRFFFSNRKNKYYLRELERILSLPVGNIRRELISLEKLGLFKRKKVGNLVYYSLNENYSFFEAVEGMILKSGKKKDKKTIRGNSESKKNIESMVIEKEDLESLFSKIGELENLLESVSRNSVKSQKKRKKEKRISLKLKPIKKNR